MDDRELVQAALAARKNAYAPYSHFRVGAALLAEDGTVYTGCNMENSSYGATLCAERAAFAQAVSHGARRFQALAVVGGPEEGITAETPPCGICRQVMAEFCGPEFPVLLAASPERISRYTLGQLLPEAFTGAALEGRNGEDAP